MLRYIRRTDIETMLFIRSTDIKIGLYIRRTDKVIFSVLTLRNTSLLMMLEAASSLPFELVVESILRKLHEANK